VAVGHTADDQVETVLMHFIRGAGLKGLKGMPYRALLEEFDTEIPIVRPLLDTWRSETVTYCAAHGMQPHFDATNESIDFLRNRLRHELIPTIETYNPRFREAVWRAGKTLSADHELLLQVVEPSWRQCLLQKTDHYVGLNLAILSEQSAAVQMHVLRRAAQCLLPGHDTGYADLQRAAAFIAKESQARADFVGGLTLVREASVLYMTANENVLPSDQWPQMPAGTDSLRCSAPSTVALASGWVLTSTECNSPDVPTRDSWQDADPWEAFLDTAKLPDALELRVRHSGDRFQPLGMHGRSQKLSDFFVNVKMPSRARDRWPLVCAGDQIIWVPGYRPAHVHRVLNNTTEVLHLAIMRRN
jgi:tRNA(Ile)-lysidine synthase